MIAFLRLAVIGFLVLTALYWLLWVYARSLRRESLEKRWDAAAAEGAAPGQRDAYIRDGMREHGRSLRRRLVLLVYGVPLALVAALIWLNNYS